MKFVSAVLSALRIAAGCLCVGLVLVPAALAQNVVVNSDFSAGAENWETTDIGGEFFAEVVFEESDLCPTEGSPGGCAIVLGSTGANITVVWQEITLIAGNTYDVDSYFRMLTPAQEDFWFEFHVTPVAPEPGVDWIGNNWEEMPYGFASWRNCGADYDGLLSEDICVGTIELPFTVPGAPGEEVTYYVGMKGGTGSSEEFAWSLDDVSVTLVGGTAAETAETPESFSIDGVYPNPFNPSTTAVVSLREYGTYTVRLYDMLGRVVQERSLVGTPGRMELPFDLSTAGSGTYLVWIQHRESGRTATARALLVK